MPVEYFKPSVRVLDRDNVALLVLLAPRGCKSKQAADAAKLCVANTHLLFNPRRGDIKLAQAMVLFAEMDKLSFVRHHPKTGTDKHHPTFLCGDFNCEPFCDLYRFVGRGILEYPGLLQRTISGQEEGRYGNDYRLGKQLVPPALGITDKCQYAAEVRRRWEEFRDAKGRASQLRDTADEKEETSVTRVESPGSSSPGESNEIIDLTSEKENSNKMVDLKEGSCTPVSSPEDVSSPSRDEKGKPCHVKEPVIEQCTGMLSHRFQLVSVYNHEVHDGRGSQREATTRHGRANTTVDYIFYSAENRRTRTHKHRFKYHAVREGRLRLVSKLVLATEKQFDQGGCLPNQAVSSDHTVLMAKFTLNLK